MLVVATTPPVADLHPEAAAVNASRAGATITWGDSVAFASLGGVSAAAREWGGASIRAYRTDPSLISDLYLGSWFDVRWRRRPFRRVSSRLHRVWPLVFSLAPRQLVVAAAVDAAFWAGARAEASAAEWNRLTRNCYAALYYHRIAGAGRSGEERIDISPRAFARHMRVLRLFRFTPLTVQELLAFHERLDATIPLRSFVLTIDDGFRDTVEPLLDHAQMHPQMFVCTDVVGGAASWTEAAARIVSWEDLAAFMQSGIAIGSHSTTHARLTELPEAELRDALERSRSELVDRLPEAVPVLAYPHGNEDERVRKAVARAGYRLAYTTTAGKNGAGADPLRLRRVGPKEWDSALSLLWKALTGEALPGRWELRLLARAERGRRQPQSMTRPPGDE